jgi:hypothetical protein
MRLLSTLHDFSTGHFISWGTQPSLLNLVFVNKGNLNAGSDHDVFPTRPDGGSREWASFVKVACTRTETWFGDGLGAVTVRHFPGSCHVLDWDLLFSPLECSKTSWRRHDLV